MCVASRLASEVGLGQYLPLIILPRRHMLAGYLNYFSKFV
jgi:hypothetical protein